MTPSAFDYEKLQDPANEIRLLRLIEPESPTGVSDRISCELTAWRVKEAPDYIAVSYTWGTPGQEAEILVNGKAFEVRPNCLYLLEQARDRDTTGYLWIDAICINQLDDHEKSAQVAMMGDIYRKATRTDVCIGPHADDSEYLFEAIEEHVWWVHRQVQEAYTSGRLQAGRHQLEDHEKRSIEENMKRMSLPNPDLQTLNMWPRWVYYPPKPLSPTVNNWVEHKLHNKRVWEAIYTLIRRPYFTRMWIVQELVLSRTAIVFCGNSSIAFEAIAEFEDSLYSCPSGEFGATKLDFWQEHWAFQTLSEFARKYKDMSEVGLGLGDLIRKTSDFKCADPRDRTFSVVSLVNWRGLKPMRPDNEKSKLEVVLQTIGHIYEIASRRDTQPNNDVYDDRSVPDPVGDNGIGYIGIRDYAIAFGLTALEPDIDALLQQRRCGAGPYPTVLPYETSDIDGLKIEVNFGYFSRLLVDNITGELTSCLAARYPREYFSRNERSVKSLQVCDQLRDAPSQNHTIRTIRSEGLLCAKLPENAQAGDLIISFQVTHFSNVGLLVRGSPDNIERLQIIGQVILEDHTRLCDSRDGCVCGHPRDAHSTVEMSRGVRLKVLFDPLDLMLFACQTLGTSDEASRLETSVTRPGDVWSSYVERWIPVALRSTYIDPTSMAGMSRGRSPYDDQTSMIDMSRGREAVAIPKAHTGRFRARLAKATTSVLDSVHSYTDWSRANLGKRMWSSAVARTRFAPRKLNSGQTTST